MHTDMRSAVRRDVLCRLLVFFHRHAPEKLNGRGLQALLQHFSAEDLRSEERVSGISAVLHAKYGRRLPGCVAPCHVLAALAAMEREEVAGGGGQLPTPVLRRLPHAVCDAVPQHSSALDMTSAQFDAIQALADPVRASLYLPVDKEARPVDNLSKATPMLAAPRVRFTEKQPRPNPEARARLEERLRLARKERSAPELLEKFIPPVLAHLAGSLRSGPYSLLDRLLRERRKVRVVIRNVNCVRGACDGFLRAFDYHMNLVLQNVVERFSQPLHKLHVASEIRERHMRQLFIRGDNVVLVHELNA